jgi:hypothetical protein
VYKAPVWCANLLVQNGMAPEDNSEERRESSPFDFCQGAAECCADLWHHVNSHSILLLLLEITVAVSNRCFFQFLLKPTPAIRASMADGTEAAGGALHFAD